MVSARGSGVEGDPCCGGVQSSGQMAAETSVVEDGSFRGSNFGFGCDEDTTGFSYSIRQLLDIRKACSPIVN
uniref:Uncharacterized protein n=1 Tax=Romanomermis culicivorax TaxID=13658 RepID=A0A915K7U0_ROMCU